MDLSGFSVSPDPTEQQRVMLLSRSPSGPKKYFPIPVEHLEEEIRVRSADDCKRFREEFNVSAPGLGQQEEQQGGQNQSFSGLRLQCCSQVGSGEPGP